MLKRSLAVMCAVVLAGTLAFGAACARSDEDVMRDTITARLDDFKTLDEDVVEELSSKMDLDTLSTWGVDGPEFTKTYLDGFDYTIDDITIDGDEAVVTVTLTCKSFSQFFSDLATRMDDITNDAYYNSLDSSRRYEYIGELTMETLEETDTTTTEPVEIKFHYDSDENAWVAESSSLTNDILTVMMNN